MFWAAALASRSAVPFRNGGLLIGMNSNIHAVFCRIDSYGSQRIE